MLVAGSALLAERCRKSTSIGSLSGEKKRRRPVTRQLSDHTPSRSEVSGLPGMTSG